MAPPMISADDKKKTEGLAAILGVKV